jgi:hypothetical protein
MKAVHAKKMFSNKRLTKNKIQCKHKALTHLKLKIFLGKIQKVNLNCKCNNNLAIFDNKTKKFYNICYNNTRIIIEQDNNFIFEFP